MAAGAFLRNRRGEVSSRYREAQRSPVHAGGPSANLFGSLTTNDASLLLRTHGRPGPWKLRRLNWKNCRTRHRTRRHWADCRNRIARARTNGLHPSVDALASTFCLHFCRTYQPKTKDCHLQKSCHPLPIRKHETLMMANFRDDAFGHSGNRRLSTHHDGRGGRAPGQ